VSILWIILYHYSLWSVDLIQYVILIYGLLQLRWDVCIPQSCSSGDFRQYLEFGIFCTNFLALSPLILTVIFKQPYFLLCVTVHCGSLTSSWPHHICHLCAHHCQLSQLVVICEQQPKAILTSRVQELSNLVHVPSQFLVPYVGMHYRHP